MEKITVEEAARRLQTTPEAIRKRIQRQSLPAEKEGRAWRVLWQPDTSQDTLQDTDRPQDALQDTPGHPAAEMEIALLKARIAALEDTIRRLETDIEEWRQRDLRKDVLLQQLTQRLPALPTPEESQQRRPWWQVWKR